MDLVYLSKQHLLVANKWDDLVALLDDTEHRIASLSAMIRVFFVDGVQNMFGYFQKFVQGIEESYSKFEQWNV